MLYSNRLFQTRRDFILNKLTSALIIQLLIQEKLSRGLQIDLLASRSIFLDNNSYTVLNTDKNIKNGVPEKCVKNAFFFTYKIIKIII